MCGIYASVSEKGHHQPSHDLQACLGLRGPDSSNLLGVESSSEAQSRIFLSFFSTVLALRGGHIVPQPLVDAATGSVLCWNGEAWKVNGERIPDKKNDGQVVLSLLTAAVEVQSQVDSKEAVLKVLRLIEGPFAFVFFDKVHNLLYFGRDCLGRRSLLYNIGRNHDLIQFSSISVAPHNGWLEVEADGVYLLDCRAINSFTSPKESETTPSSPFHKYPWSSFDAASPGTLSLGKLNFDLPSSTHLLCSASPSVLALEGELTRSLILRVLDIPDAQHSLPQNASRLAVLFSGGLDCTVLARMAHDIVPLEQSIDLLNVGFENPRVVQAALKAQQASGTGPVTTTESCYEACPDRITGRNAFRELQAACPDRRWRFVEVNIPYTETTEHKARVISLIHPHNTEMDLSIGYALYFASRGSGIATVDGIIEDDYTTTARVLLSGLGADELFGGYGRHAIAHSRRGFQGLIEELELDVNRLGKRNLGRDDRVISNWGREARFPFLDENMVRWALSRPVWDKCGFGNERKDVGNEVEPDKKVLRLLAQKLGLPTVAREKKRAIQFGARTAKMETGRTKGTTLVA